MNARFLQGNDPPQHSQEPPLGLLVFRMEFVLLLISGEPSAVCGFFKRLARSAESVKRKKEDRDVSLKRSLASRPTRPLCKMPQANSVARHLGSGPQTLSVP